MTTWSIIRRHSTLLASLLVLSFPFVAARPLPALAADAGGPTVAGDRPDYLTIGAGAFNIQSHGHGDTGPAGEGLVEWHGGRKWLDIGPVVGLMANADGGGMGYAGGYADIVYGRFVLTPMAGAGAYVHGGELNMGGVFQFRLSATGAYAFDDGSRVGVAFAHVSNANIDYRNPGENELLLTYSIAIDLGL